MAQYKIGDKIVPKDGNWGVCGNLHSGVEYAEVTMTTGYGELHYTGYDKNGNTAGSCWGCLRNSNVKLYEKNWDTLEVGDILECDGYRCRVLAIIGEMVATSRSDEHDRFLCWNDITHLKKEHTIVQDEPEPEPTELTMQEIADEFGVDVSKLKIRKG